MQGLFTAIITPFKEDLSIDYDALKNLIHEQEESGVDGIVVAGSTGESSTLTMEEHGELMHYCRKTIKKCLFIAGTGSNNTAEAILLTKEAEKIGADASLQVCPYYVKPTQEGLFLHFSEIAKNTRMSLILYNIPGRTGINIDVNTVVRLSAIKNIIGIKESSGNMAQAAEIVTKARPDFIVLAGDDNICLPISSMGGKGLISVSGNMYPKTMKKYVDECISGSYRNAQKMMNKLLPFFQMMSIEQNPIPIKTSVSWSGKVKEVFRLPLCRISSNNKKILTDFLSQFNDELMSM